VVDLVFRLTAETLFAESTISNLAKNQQDKYILLLDQFQKANPAAPKLGSKHPAAIAEHVVKHSPDGNASEWLDQLFALNVPEAGGRSLPIGSIALVFAGLAISTFLAVGIFFSGGFLEKLANPDVARGLVTFLFAFATIAIFVIASIAIFWADFEQVEKRAGLAKELIAVMIGVLGTILGFYFGSASSGTPDAQQPQAPAAVVSTEGDTQ
jgi:hypothetical protein